VFDFFFFFFVKIWTTLLPHMPPPLELSYTPGNLFLVSVIGQPVTRTRGFFIPSLIVVALERCPTYTDLGADCSFLLWLWKMSLSHASPLFENQERRSQMRNLEVCVANNSKIASQATGHNIHHLHKPRDFASANVALGSRKEGKHGSGSSSIVTKERSNLLRGRCM
jgi:hypothetical protein